MTFTVLSVAGSDPSGGAGIQADLKTFSALGAYGAAAITALTAQNTRTVAAIHDVPRDFVAAQIDTVFEDIEIRAVKIGMLSKATVIATVAERLKAHGARRVGVDPGMAAPCSGRRGWKTRRAVWRCFFGAERSSTSHRRTICS